MSNKTETFERMCRNRNLVCFKVKEENGRAYYKYARNEDGARLKSIDFNVDGLEVYGPHMLNELFNLFEDFKHELAENGDGFTVEFASYVEILDDIAKLAQKMSNLNIEKLNVNCEEPWHEVIEVFS